MTLNTELPSGRTSAKNNAGNSGNENIDTTWTLGLNEIPMWKYPFSAEPPIPPQLSAASASCDLKLRPEKADLASL